MIPCFEIKTTYAVPARMGDVRSDPGAGRSNNARRPNCLRFLAGFSRSQKRFTSVKGTRVVPTCGEKVTTEFLTQFAREEDLREEERELFDYMGVSVARGPRQSAEKLSLYI
jgi:hypothetical protein